MRTSETGASAGDDGHSAFKVDCHDDFPARTSLGEFRFDNRFAPAQRSSPVTQASYLRVKDRSGGEMRDSADDSLMRSGAHALENPEATWKNSAPFSPR